jgi:hypothetical protein
MRPYQVHESECARANGYQNLMFTEVPGASHEAFSERVIAFFASLLSKEQD